MGAKYRAEFYRFAIVSLRDAMQRPLEDSDNRRKRIEAVKAGIEKQSLLPDFFPRTKTKIDFVDRAWIQAADAAS